MWFVYALLSTFFSGFHTFSVKVGAENKFDTYLLSGLSSLVSFFCGLLLYLIASPAEPISLMLWWFAGVSGVLFAAFAFARLESLKYMDAALFFPLYKVIGPALVAVIGIFLLHENVSFGETVGIVLSCLVPLLLITPQEHHRQKNLKLGLILMTASTTIAAIASVVNSLAVEGNASAALPLAFIVNGIVFALGAVMFVRRRPGSAERLPLKSHFTRPFILLCLANGILQFLGFYTQLLGFSENYLTLVYSVTSHYIVIPVILSVWVYKEHWSKQKAFALVVSICALILLHR